MNLIVQWKKESRHMYQMSSDYKKNIGVLCAIYLLNVPVEFYFRLCIHTVHTNMYKDPWKIIFYFGLLTRSIKRHCIHSTKRNKLLQIMVQPNFSTFLEFRFYIVLFSLVMQIHFMKSIVLYHTMRGKSQLYLLLCDEQSTYHIT